MLKEKDAVLVLCLVNTVMEVVLLVNQSSHQ